MSEARRVAEIEWARAYGGEAHHLECAVPGEPPPQYLDLPVRTGTRRYRLVRHPRTGEPARDPAGALVFVPARQDSAPAQPTNVTSLVSETPGVRPGAARDRP